MNNIILAALLAALGFCLLKSESDDIATFGLLAMITGVVGAVTSFIGWFY